MTENVVDFMAGKLRTNTQKTQNALKYAACIGNEFDLKNPFHYSGGQPRLQRIVQ